MSNSKFSRVLVCINDSLVYPISNKQKGIYTIGKCIKSNYILQNDECDLCACTIVYTKGVSKIYGGPYKSIIDENDKMTSSVKIKFATTPDWYKVSLYGQLFSTISTNKTNRSNIITDMTFINIKDKTFIWRVGYAATMCLQDTYYAFHTICNGPFVWQYECCNNLINNDTAMLWMSTKIKIKNTKDYICPFCFEINKPIKLGK